MSIDQKNVFPVPSPTSDKSLVPKSHGEPVTAVIKRKTPVIFYSKKQKRKRFSLRFLLLPFFAAFLALFTMYSYAEARLAPQIRELAQAQAKRHLTQTVNDAVAELSSMGEIEYGHMVKTVRDPSGEVIYLEVDTAMLAGAKAKLVSRIDQMLEENKRITLSVPVGSLSETNLFSGYGLPIRVRIYPIGITEGEIFTVLEDCGINQTRHLIQVKISVTLFLVLPGENAKVDTEVVLPLGERVLVGDVPEIYLDTLGAG